VRSQKKSEFKSELCAFERQTSFKAVQGVSRNSSFFIAEGKMFVVQQGMKRVVENH
jgi:hypothetical protein